MQTLDLACKLCGRIFQWVQNPMEKPKCPQCGGKWPDGCKHKEPSLELVR